MQNREDTVEVEETWYRNRDGYWVRRWTVLETGEIIDRETLHKELPIIKINTKESGTR